MSLSVFNPSLCRLSPFYLVFCCCFMTILPVHKKFTISIMSLKSRKFWLNKWVTVDTPLISWGDTFIFKNDRKDQASKQVSKLGFHMLGKTEMIRNFTVSPPSGILMPNIMKTQIIDIVDTLDNFRRIDFCDGWQSFENSNLYYWGCKGSMSNFCSDLILCQWNVQFLSCPPKPK